MAVGVSNLSKDNLLAIVAGMPVHHLCEVERVVGIMNRPPCLEDSMTVLQFGVKEKKLKDLPAVLVS